MGRKTKTWRIAKIEGDAGEATVWIAGRPYLVGDSIPSYDAVMDCHGGPLEVHVLTERVAVAKLTALVEAQLDENERYEGPYRFGW